MLDAVLSIRRMSVVIISASAILLGACSSKHNVTAETAGSPTAAAATSSAAAPQDEFVRTIAKVRPSVVEIATDSGLGSGVVYDTSGNIVTNAHVVGDASQFRVALSNGRVVDASLVGTYPAGDLAVGNPLGLSSSVTEGIVSSTGRTVGEGNGVVPPSSIQTSAPINPGNSGGAFVNVDGALIGIPTLAAINPELGSAAVGIGFAIPSNTVKLIADQLIKDGKVTRTGRAALGVVGSDAVDAASGKSVGVLVRDVKVDSAAAKAGVNVGDLITGVDGMPVSDLNALADVLAEHQPGDRVKVDVRHPDGTSATIELALDELTR